MSDAVKNNVLNAGAKTSSPTSVGSLAEKGVGTGPAVRNAKQSGNTMSSVLSRISNTRAAGQAANTAVSTGQNIGDQATTSMSKADDQIGSSTIDKANAEAKGNQASAEGAAAQVEAASTPSAPPQANGQPDPSAQAAEQAKQSQAQIEMLNADIKRQQAQQEVQDAENIISQAQGDRSTAEGMSSKGQKIENEGSEMQAYVQSQLALINQEILNLFATENNQH